MDVLRNLAPLEEQQPVLCRVWLINLFGLLTPIHKQLGKSIRGVQSSQHTIKVQTLLLAFIGTKFSPSIIAILGKKGSAITKESMDYSLSMDSFKIPLTLSLMTRVWLELTISGPIAKPLTEFPWRNLTGSLIWL